MSFRVFLASAGIIPGTAVHARGGFYEQRFTAGVGATDLGDGSVLTENSSETGTSVAKVSDAVQQESQLTASGVTGTLHCKHAARRDRAVRDSGARADGSRAGNATSVSSPPRCLSCQSHARVHASRYVVYADPPARNREAEHDHHN